MRQRWPRRARFDSVLIDDGISISWFISLWDFDNIISSIQGMGFGQIADLIATNRYKILSDDKKAKRRTNESC